MPFSTFLRESNKWAAVPGKTVEIIFVPMIQYLASFLRAACRACSKAMNERAREIALKYHGLELPIGQYALRGNALSAIEKNFADARRRTVA